MKTPASIRKRQKRIIKGCKVVATYLGWGRTTPVMFTGTVKAVSNTHVTIYPDRIEEGLFLQSHGRFDKDGKHYVTVSRKRTLRID